MKTAAFIADTPAAALAQIHAELGPEAVVLNVRQLPAQGMARLLPGRHRVEVIAGVPEAEDSPQSFRTQNDGGFSSSSFPSSFSFSSLDSDSRTKDESEEETSSHHRLSPGQRESTAGLLRAVGGPNANWRSVRWLEEMGLLPAFASRLQAHLNTRHGAVQPESIEAEWKAVSTALASAWRPAPPMEEGAIPLHVFIGPPGSGKTTALCKWLTQAVLTQDRTARVWRLDAGTANASEFLSLHCEMLGVPVDRSWAEPDNRADLLFVDLPGADPRDAVALTALGNQLASLPSPRVHLVLNAAYETAALLAQWSGFEALRPEDVILTHLDEEQRRVKLWNLVFGTNCTVSYLSGGQKIPGEFRMAAPEHFFPVRNR
jgi:flagellar biosynthesis protein FlhF